MRLHLTGRGGVLAGGRWHSAGTPVVYLAQTPAGAMLEVLVHLEVDKEDFPDTLQLLRVEIDDKVAIEPTPVLKQGWSKDLRFTKRIGDTFLGSGSALLLPIPSAIMPHTHTYLFNPLHLDAAKAQVSVETFCVDNRLFS